MPFDEAPTKKHEVPSELRDLAPATHVTAKLRRADMDELLRKARQSGTRAAITDEDIARFQRRACDTIPAPPELEESTERDGVNPAPR